MWPSYWPGKWRWHLWHPSLELVTPDVNMALHSSTSRETQDSEYWQRFMEINNHYETEKFVPVYTDDSKSDNYVSSSAVFPDDIFKTNVPVHTSIFTAEAVALKLAVQYIQRDAFPKLVIYSDSLSCLQALANKKKWKSYYSRNRSYYNISKRSWFIHCFFVGYLVMSPREGPGG